MNAENAGVEQLINFETKDFRDISIPEPPGIVILNPEYGLRLGEETKARTAL
jgi:putative N6-adenine-specific DNA methylase